jgi:hypothetical protein
MSSALREDLKQDVEVPDRPEPGPDLAKISATTACRVAFEPIAEHPPGGTHPTSGNAHRVNLLWVLAREDARHTREHPREVEAEDLTTGLGPRVVAADAWRSSDRNMLEGCLGGLGTQLVEWHQRLV